MLNLSLSDKLKDISFCDKQCSNVNDNSTKDKIITYIQDNLGVNVIDRMYMVLRPNFLKNICFNQHVVSLLSHGNPYILYLTKVDGVNCCFYIDRKLKEGFNYPKIHNVKYRFSDELFNDTIFTGELVRDSQRKWFFLLSDILMRNGEIYRGKKNILTRYQEINDILINHYVKDSDIECCPIQVKKLFMYKDIKSIINNFIPNLSYKTKGLIFYTLTNKHSDYLYIIPREKTIQINDVETVREKLMQQEPSLFQIDNNSSPQNTILNEEEENMNLGTELLDTNNIVFKVLKTETSDIYNLYTNDKENIYKHDIALVPNLKCSKMLRKLFDDKSNELGVNMECKYSSVFEKWIPLRKTEIDTYDKTKLMDVITELNKSKIESVF